MKHPKRNEEKTKRLKDAKKITIKKNTAKKIEENIKRASLNKWECSGRDFSVCGGCGNNKLIRWKFIIIYLCIIDLIISSHQRALSPSALCCSWLIFVLFLLGFCACTCDWALCFFGVVNGFLFKIEEKKILSNPSKKERKI